MLPIKIHVIETKRSFADLTNIKLEELQIIINTIKSSSDIVELNGFINIAKYYQSELSPFIHILKQSLITTPITVLLRNLLSIQSIYPIVVERGSNATSEFKVKNENCVYTRPKTSKRAYNRKLDEIIISSEEPILVSGLIVDSNQDGLFLKNYLESVYFHNEIKYNGLFNYSISLIENSNHDIYEYSNEYSNDGAKKIMKFVNQEQILNLMLILFTQINYSLEYFQKCSSYESFKNFSENTLSNVKNIGSFIVSSVLNTWRDKESNELLKYLIKRLSESGLPIYIKNWKYNLVPLYELVRIDVMPSYLLAISYGRDSQLLNDFIENKLVSYKKQKNLNEIEKTINTKKNITKIYLIIIKQKLGIERLNQIYELSKKQSIKNKSLYSSTKLNAFSGYEIEIDDIDFIISLLDEKEKSIVNNEYEIMQSNIKAQIENKCKHLVLFKRINSHRTLEQTKKLLKDIDEFKSDNKDEIIKCKVCNYNLICPHMYEKMKMETMNYSLEKQLEHLTKYILGIHNGSDTYFCKICSGLIIENYENEKDIEIRNKYGNFNSELRTTIWALSLRIIKTLKFSTLINEKQFASSIVDFIYPLIIDAEQLISSKRKRKKNTTTSETENIDSRLYIYIVIYIYAYMIALIQNSQSNKSLNINFGDVKPNSKIVVYVDKIMKQILIDYAVILSSIEDITIEFIKERLIEAYDIIHKGYNTEISNSKPEEELIMQLLLDPTMNYSTVVSKIIGDLQNNVQLTPEKALYEFQYILGSTLDEFIKTSQENINKPLNIFRFLYEPSNKKIGKYFKEYQLLLNLESIENNPNISNIMFFVSYGLFVKKIKNDEIVSDFMEYKELEKKLEKKYVNEKVEFSISTLQHLNFETYITEIFDEKGAKHIWNKKSTYYYLLDGKTIEIKGEDLMEYKLNNKGDLKIVDVSCAICKVKKSDLYKLSIEKATNSLNIKYKLNSLFIYFEITCPLGDTHIWENKKCKKCKLSHDLISLQDKSNNQEATNYYLKYVNIFDIEKKALSYYSFAEHSKKEIKKFEWKSNYSYIVDTAELASVPVKIIEALGNMEGREYEDIVNGKDSHPLPDNKYDNRLYVLDSKIRSLLADYNMLRNVQNMLSIPPLILDILNTTGINKTEYHKLHNLPTIGEEYLIEYEYFIETLQPNEMFLYLQEMLCKIIITIYGGNNKVMSVFAKKEILSIIENQKMTLKAGLFNWAIFEEDTYDEDYDDEINEINETEETEFNPFVSDNMDYDTSEDNPNNEPN